MYFPGHSRRSHATRNPGSAVYSSCVSVTLEFGMWAGGAAAPIPAGGAGAGGGSNKKTHMRRKQREAERAERAQLAGEH